MKPTLAPVTAPFLCCPTLRAQLLGVICIPCLQFLSYSLKLTPTWLLPPPVALKLSFSKSPLTSSSHLSVLVLPDLLFDTADLPPSLKFLHLAYRPPYFGFPLTSLTMPPHTPSLVSDNFSDLLMLVCPKIWSLILFSY